MLFLLVVSEDPLSVGGEPNMVLLVLDDVLYRRMNVIVVRCMDVEKLNFLCFKVKRIQPFFSTYPQHVIGSIQGIDVFIDTQVVYFVFLDILTVVTVQTIVCAKPNVSLFVLNNSTDTIG